MLRHKGLARAVTVPVSAGLLTNTDAYFDALTAYRNGNLGPIASQVSRAALAGVRLGRQLLTDLRAIRVGWDERVSARRDSGVWRVADLLLRRPIVDARVVADELNVLPPNVYGFLDQLERVGVVTESTDQRRNRIWRAPEILTALDRFAASASRRGGRRF